MIPKMSFNDENEVLYVKFTEVWDEKDVPEIFSRIRRYLDGKERRMIIGDLSQAVPQSYSKKFRKMVADEAKTLNLDKVAVLGANSILRMMAKVILAVIGKKWSMDTKFFASEAEALAWLKGEK